MCRVYQRLFQDFLTLCQPLKTPTPSVVAESSICHREMCSFLFKPDVAVENSGGEMQIFFYPYILFHILMDNVWVAVFQMSQILLYTREEMFLAAELHTTDTTHPFISLLTNQSGMCFIKDPKGKFCIQVWFSALDVSQIKILEWNLGPISHQIFEAFESSHRCDTQRLLEQKWHSSQMQYKFHCKCVKMLFNNFYEYRKSINNFLFVKIQIPPYLFVYL